MKDRSDDPSHHERMVLPQSYILLPDLIRVKVNDRVRVGMVFRVRVQFPLLTQEEYGWKYFCIYLNFWCSSSNSSCISRSSECSTTGVTKTVVCVILSVR